MVANDDISQWQRTWKALLDMAYYRKDPIPFFVAPAEFSCQWKHHPDFEKLTFNYAWREYDKEKDSDGFYIVPQVVPELKQLLVPYDLFYCLGSNTFMSKCFPNCKVLYYYE
jgi:hypothetical protein